MLRLLLKYSISIIHKMHTYILDIKTSTGNVTGKEAEDRAMQSGGSSTFTGSNIVSSDQQTSSNVALRDHLRLASRDVKRSIQNRWSGNGIGTVAGESPPSTSFSADEHQGLLSGAAEPPFDSPLLQPRTHKQQPSMISVATSTDNPNINNVSEEYVMNPTPSSSYFNPNQNTPNFDHSMTASYSTSTTINKDGAPPPYTTAYSTNSSQRPLPQQPNSSTSGAPHMYASTYGNSPAQPHNMDTPSTSQLQRTINRTLLGGNESTMLSEQQQPPPGFFLSTGRETTIC